MEPHIELLRQALEIVRELRRAAPMGPRATPGHTNYLDGYQAGLADALRALEGLPVQRERAAWWRHRELTMAEA
jgi:hypothetical protein